MNTTNKQDETLEPLDLLVNELRQSNARQYTCVNDSGYSQLERNIVTILTTWQKEQDRIIIDKLIEALGNTLSILEKERNYIGVSLYKSYAPYYDKAKELLQLLK